MNSHQSNHNYSIFKRISSLMLLVISGVIGVNLYVMHSQSAATWYAVESEQLGRSLTLQAAQLIAAPLAVNDQETVMQYIEVINQGMFVKGAVLFNELGIAYAQEETNLSVVEKVKNNTVAPLVFVEDIVVDGDIIGYIKLLLDKQAVTEHHRNFNQNLFSQSLLIIILSVIASGLATRLFYKTRERYRQAARDDNAL